MEEKKVNEAAFRVVYDALGEAMQKVFKSPEITGCSAEEVFSNMLTVVAYNANIVGVDVTEMLERLREVAKSPDVAGQIARGKALRIAQKALGQGW